MRRKTKMQNQSDWIALAILLALMLVAILEIKLGG